FFFQAEDGIRDFHVTGVQTCALPIWVADRGILMARTDPDARPHKGISFFLIDMASPGVELRPLRQMNGDAEFDEVFLSEVRLPRSEERRVGKEDGARRAPATRTRERR